MSAGPHPRSSTFSLGTGFTCSARYISQARFPPTAQRNSRYPEGKLKTEDSCLIIILSSRTEDRISTGRRIVGSARVLQSVGVCGISPEELQVALAILWNR